MNHVATAARYLLGILFTVFGLNGFLHFIPQPPPASPLAIQYMTALSASNYFAAVFAIQLAAGLLLLANRHVPLALAMLGPVLVNILLYHGLMDPAGMGPGVLATALWTVLFLRWRDAFRGIFQAGA